MKDITGYEGLYAIEEDGRVWSYRRNKYLSQNIDTNGYYKVDLSSNGKSKHQNIHRLLAYTYIPNPENKDCIDHINRNRLDNRIENLRWATKKENSENRSLRVDNLAQEQYIRTKRCKTTYGIYTYYVFGIKRNNINHIKPFKTLQEAIAYRDDYLKELKVCE